MKNPEYYRPIPSGRYKGWSPPGEEPRGQVELFIEARREHMKELRKLLMSDDPIEPEDRVELQFALGWYQQAAKETRLHLDTDGGTTVL